MKKLILLIILIFAGCNKPNTGYVVFDSSYNVQEYWVPAELTKESVEAIRENLRNWNSGVE